MTERAPLPPVPDLAALIHSGHPVLADVGRRLLQPRPDGARYEDSPYITPRQETK